MNVRAAIAGFKTRQTRQILLWACIAPHSAEFASSHILLSAVGTKTPDLVSFESQTAGRAGNGCLSAH